MSSHALLAVALWATPQAVPAPQTASAAPSDPWRFGDFRLEWPARPASEPDPLGSPSAVDVGPDGRIWIAESTVARLCVLHENGKLLRRIEVGPAGEKRELSGVGVALDGEVYLTDAAQHVVLRLDRDGTLLGTFGGRGAESGKLREPRGIAVDGGRVLVADAGNARVSAFSRAGVHLFDVGRTASSRGELLWPVDVAADAQGRIYVADAAAQRVSRFGAQGEPETSWGGAGVHPGLFQAPSGIECHAGRVYVADRDNHRVQVFDADGKVLHEWGVHALLPRQGAGKLHYPSDVAIAPKGSFATVLEGFEDRVQLFGPETAAPEPQPLERTTAAHYEGGCDARNGYAALIEPGGPTVALFDLRGAEPIEITRFGLAGCAPGRLLAPSDVAFALDGASVWIADPLAGRISEFRVARAPDAPPRFEPYLARFVRALELDLLDGLPSAPWPPEPCALAFAESGELFISDRANARVIVLDLELAHLRTIARFGAKGSALLTAGELAVASDGSAFWIADPRAREIHALRFDGAFLGTWQLPKPGGGAYQPAGLATDGDGGLWCSAQDAHALFHLSARGQVLATVGRRGEKDGAIGWSGLLRLEWMKPAGLARDGERIVAVDTGNHRFQVLDRAGAYVTAWGARAFLAPALVAPEQAR